ncbi:hypothetical protein FJ420_30710 [Mesorhizobium sp. B3-1-3]|uniref:hypothetical protein n=1 Tax=unclassified Mesorhizobium TaxID=325217 RepID=UPI0011279DEE|nr:MULTISPECIES: hypothetical protein [unclassified Mesorhizobium]TPI54190.1 hypothetical protein FJ424_31340 [Mesorhizobium sp. B3-1-8]TPI61448.1 hypothetical protein FJ420_30710 [Mesorhizobium sp. B3-1-3]
MKKPKRSHSKRRGHSRKPQAVPEPLSAEEHERADGVLANIQNTLFRERKHPTVGQYLDRMAKSTSRILGK